MSLADQPLAAAPGRRAPLPRCWASLAAFLLTILWAGLASAQDISLSNLILDNIDGRISVRFGVDFANPQAVETALNEGAELALVCNARLAAKRDYWIDREVGRAEAISQIRHPAPGQFLITLPGRPAPLTGSDFPALLAKAFDDVTINLGPWGVLKRGVAYSLSMEIRLERVNVTPWVKNTLFFWSFDAAPAARYRLDFTY